MAGPSNCYCVIFKRMALLAARPSNKCLQLRYKATSVAPPIEKYDPERPIRFSTSEAGWDYKVAKSLSSVPNYPWYKEVILWGSFFFCLNYFMFFRQPNDIDESLDMPLGKRLLWIQELHLLDEKKKLLSNGNSADSVDIELKHIDELRKKYKYI